MPTRAGSSTLAVVEHPDRLQLVYVDSDQIGTEEGDGEDGEEPLYPLDVGDVGVIDVEPARLERLEACLNLPTRLVGFDSLFRLVERDEYLEFGLTFAVIHPCGEKVAVLVDCFSEIGVLEVE